MFLFKLLSQSLMYSSHVIPGWIKQTASCTLAVSLFLGLFVNQAFGAVLINGQGGFITNTQSVSATRLSTSEVYEATGGFIYDYPITLPEGVDGHTPTVALTYNSQSASDMQLAGYGFSPSIPYIERLNKFGSEAMFGASSTYWSSLSGELVVDGAEYGAKREQGDFLSYDFTANEWTTTDKSGTTYHFGSTTNSRQSNPNDGTEVSRWYVSSITDANGNEISFEYTQDTGVVYPSSIAYGPYQVDFTLEASDPHTSAALGFLAERDQRIAGIEVLEGSTVFKRYELAYVAGVNGSRDVLASITENAIVDGVSTSLPPTEFDYDGSEAPAWQIDNSVDFPEPLGTKDKGVRFADLNWVCLKNFSSYLFQITL